MPLTTVLATEKLLLNRDLVKLSCPPAAFRVALAISLSAGELARVITPPDGGFAESTGKRRCRSGRRDCQC